MGRHQWTSLKHNLVRGLNAGSILLCKILYKLEVTYYELFYYNDGYIENIKLYYTCPFALSLPPEVTTHDVLM